MSYPAPIQLSRDGTSEKARIVINSGGENGNVAFEGEASSGIGFTSNLGDPTRSTSDVGERKVMFDNSTLTPHDQYVLVMPESPSHVIKWELNDGVKLSKALWVAEWDSGSLTTISEATPSQDDRGMASARPGATSPPAAPLVTTKVKRQDSITMGFTDTSLTLPLDSSVLKFLFSSMYIELQWTLGEESGTTKTGLFAITNGTYQSPTYYDAVGKLADRRKKDKESAEGIEDPASSTSTSSISATQTTATPTGSLNPNASQSTLPGSSGGSSNSSGGGSGGLAPGAIAGIVIGSVLGLALIAFLIWFFLRRRRSRADHVSDGAYGTGHNPHEYLTDKETHARVTESPHSPYTDDGQHQHSQHQLHQHQSQPQEQHHLSRELHQDDHNDTFETSATAAAAAAAPTSAISPTEHHQPPFAPYREENMSTASRSVEDMTRSGAGGPRSSTPNVNSNVSHLIEDGMTEDEIRRLEEEEMALDAAIEQAGPRRKP
ncbi:hypothetical protein HER10_EVM0010667 [Colletotrichum scovillei]|uniref:Uncharacterized protein n=1 Tax=Colletotrichum scovillei TaxID=1209932 RepID=A0A9P7RK74_9PEZI|nr:uncharacterized protein HER10_EVM0010667 [Colletotrichum scovillei]KAF4777953.1 hypothetical protein HER10_EVM0010667 [Colletotrichum scovillei]KAG7058783.1 hypothetical protein JMJ77_0006154 [Colletotrichum scovillei]KAG7077387.1 hypothetical protein JMJ76_0014635 [Colletotrichum scovillei]KAG7084611.1 hypothetical protein JMJ78_0010044 [Colletotrichum scovillei]